MKKDGLVRIEKDLLSILTDEKFKGYDPYDALNSKFLNALPLKLFKLAFTQGFVYFPLNLRPIFGIRKDVNPKALGLILKGACSLRTAGVIDEEEFEMISDDLVRMIFDRNSEGHSGDCWGFNFPWQDLMRYSEPGLPTVVITSFITDALLDLCEMTGRRDLLKNAIGACKFVTDDLQRYENENGICFSYTPIDRNVVHNASLLGAGLLARVGRLTENPELIDLSLRALDFSLAYQRDDGSWPYSLNPVKETERMQVDFHQGFILDCIMDISIHSGKKNKDIEIALSKGVGFYMENQFEKGRSLWRYPKRWPIDCHHQAQGIITLSKYSRFTGQNKYLKSAKNILDFTLAKFRKKNGSFIYQKWPFLSNRIEYLRWSDAWMFLAISEYLKSE